MKKDKENLMIKNRITMMKKLAFLLPLLLMVGCTNKPSVGNNSDEIELESVMETINEVSDTVSDTVSGTASETEETSTDNHKNPTTTSYISKDLLGLISNSILNSTENDVLKNMVSDEKLSDKEITAYTSDATVAEYKKQLDEFGGFVLLVDVDNDGIDDLFFLIDDGGSMGNNSRILLKGNTDRSFYKTSYIEDVTQELAFIKYSGKNYLIETSFDYNYKKYNGINVAYFEDGQIYEKVYLTLTADEYNATIVSLEDKYRALAEKASDIAQEHYDIADMDAEILTGDAETAINEVDYKSYKKDLHFLDYNWFSSDLNNDGINEIFTKGIFETSTLRTSRCLQDALITDTIPESGVYPEIFKYYNIAVKGTLEMFWVSTVDCENIINLITYNSITDYAVNGYLVKGESVLKVYEVNFKGNRKVVSTIYTRGINYVDNEAGW